DKKYFDVYITYAKASEEDILIKINIKNRAKEAAEIWLLPTLLFRNEWGFKENIEKPTIKKEKSTANFGKVRASHKSLADYYLYFEQPDKYLFTENDSNAERLFGLKNETPYVKDLFHDMVTKEQYDLADKKESGTKFAPLYHYTIEGDGN
ncbi:MAG TPA: glucosidase, partial [Saprospiraceae bacterium]|nr:glucosidase [Saprospiraceae bacterium]